MMGRVRCVQISQKTVGILIEHVAANNSQASLGSFLMRHSLGDADPGVDNRKFSSMSVARRSSLALEAAFKSGKEDQLIDLAATVLRDHEDVPSSPEGVRELLESLRADGFTCTPKVQVTPSASGWGTPTTEVRWTVTSSLGYTALPVATLSSDLADQLSTKGFPIAAGHYDQALTAFRKRSWAASNGQLRTTFESVLIELATTHTGVVPSGGGAAIEALAGKDLLPYGPNEYVRGLWKLSHKAGSHPGLSNEEDAHHRMYAISAIVGWLVRSYA